MDHNTDFLKNYRRRMVRTAIVSSACFGLAVGAGAGFLTAFLSWLFSYNGVWLAVGIALGAALLAGILIYFLRLRPTPQDVVRKVDSMGLEERTVTMMELRGDESPMAKIQRGDAGRKLGSVTAQQVKKFFPLFTVGAGGIAVMCVLLAACVGMTTVTGLTSAGVLPDPGIVAPERESFVTVSYLVEEGGMIEGEEEQILSAGENATPVVAVAEDGWIFVRWSDGGKTTQRTDYAVTADLVVTAIFEEIDEDGEGEEDGSMSDDVEGDYDQNAPEADENDGAGNSGDAGDGGEGDGDGSTGEGSGQGSGGQEGEGNGDGQGEGAGGGWTDNNQIIDGSTDYRDVFETYYDLMLDILENGGTLPPELIEFIERYFGSL